jgi:hypothetical protein
MNPINNLTPCFFKIHFNFIVTSGQFLCGLCTEILYIIIFLACHMPNHLILLDLITIVQLGEEYLPWNFFLCSFFLPPVTSSHPHPVQIFKAKNLNKTVAGHLTGCQPKARNKDKDLRIATWNACLCMGEEQLKLRWMDGIEDHLRMLNVRGWRWRALDRREWKTVLEKARAQTGLYSH